MKVAIACPYDWSYPGGVKSHIVGLADALRRRDVQVQVIAPAGRFSFRGGADENHPPEIFLAGRSVGIPFNGSVARICFSPQARSRIAKKLAESDIDVLHVHEPAAPSVSLLALTVAKVPTVATFHAASAGMVAYRIAKPVLAGLFGRLDGRIAVSEAAMHLASRTFPAASYRIVPNGIDLKRLAHGAAAKELLSFKPFVVFVGRAEPRKGLGTLIEAMQLVRETIPAGLVLVGPSRQDVAELLRGSPRPKDKANREGLTGAGQEGRAGGIPPWIQALGSVSQERLTGILRAGDVFCAPSLKGESFGIVLAEAMAAGLPVVCSDIPGYKQAAAGAALHSPAGDARATAALITSVLTDPEKAARLKELGSKRAAELDWEVLVDEVIDCYLQAIRNHR